MPTRSTQEVQGDEGLRRQLRRGNAGDCSGERDAGMTNSVDTVIGKVLEAVDALDPNTYVVYISDNGTPMYGRPNLDFIDNMYLTRKGRGKGTAFESGTRVPMAIRGPGIAANTRAERSSTRGSVLDDPGLRRLEGAQDVPNSGGTGTCAGLGLVVAAAVHQAEHARREQGLPADRDPEPHDARSHAPGRGAERVYKVVCTNGSEARLRFYNLDRIRSKSIRSTSPRVAPTTRKGVWKTADPRWNYCRLIDVVKKHSFL